MGQDAKQKRVPFRNFAFKYFLSACAASVAETVTYPLDLTKTRLQIQGEVKSVPKHEQRRMVRTALGIVQEEGLLKLWQGLSPALTRQVVYTGFRMGFYEFFRENILHKKPDGTFPVWKAALGGLTAGGLAQFITSPADIVKVQMQMEGKRRLEGHPARVKSMAHAFRQIIQDSGYRGLWRGWVPNVQRAALVNLGDLATYDTAKHLIIRKTNLGDTWVSHTLASICSGITSALLGTPADVIKTRVMNQPTENGRGLLYKSSVDCLLKTVREEGFLALYKGFIPIWSRMAPWSLVFWLSYEEIRKVSGVSSF